MPAQPITATTGDPVFRGIASSVDSVRRFSRAASDSAVKLNTQERIVSPGEDSLSFAASRSLRSQLGGLRAVQESGQLNVTTLNLAIEGLESIRGQLDGIKRLIVQAQSASTEDRDSLQAEIDLALKQIDSTAASTKVGGRSLLNGSASFNAVRSIAANGGQTQFSINAGAISFGGANTDGIRAVRINKVGANGPIRTLDDGSRVLSLRVSLRSTNRATRPSIRLTAGANGSFAEFRVTGKLGSATIRINSSANTVALIGGTATAFNQLAAETGVVLTSGAGPTLTTVGGGPDDFVKVELIAASTAAAGATFGNVGGLGPIGEAQTATARGGIATINGTTVNLGGEFGTTARLQENGYDIEIDFTPVAVFQNQQNAAITTRFNAKIDGGIGGLLGAGASSGESVRYGIGNFSTESLGRGNGINSVSRSSTGALAISALVGGNRVLGNDSVANLGSGGALSLESTRLTEALQVVDRATKQVVKEQARLGVLQANFMEAVSRAEAAQGNISTADADILGVDAAAEITNLVQSQVGVATATALSSQMTGVQQTVLSMLRG